MRVLIHVDQAAGVVDVSVPKFVYNSQARLQRRRRDPRELGSNQLTFRMIRDSDSLIEQYSGIQARYDRLSLAGGRIRLGFEFDAYEDQYDASTLSAL